MDALGLDTGYQIMQIVLLLVLVVLLGTAIRRWLRRRS